MYLRIRYLTQQEAEVARKAQQPVFVLQDGHGILEALWPGFLDWLPVLPVGCMKQITNKNAQKLGSREQIMYNILKAKAPNGTVAEEDLIEGYKAGTPKGDTDRDQRRNHARSALTSLIAKRLAYKHGEDRVSLTPSAAARADSWQS